MPKLFSDCHVNGVFSQRGTSTSSHSPHHHLLRWCSPRGLTPTYAPGHVLLVLACRDYQRLPTAAFRGSPVLPSLSWGDWKSEKDCHFDSLIAFFLESLPPPLEHDITILWSIIFCWAPHGFSIRNLITDYCLSSVNDPSFSLGSLRTRPLKWW